MAVDSTLCVTLNAPAHCTTADRIPVARWCVLSSGVSIRALRSAMNAATLASILDPRPMFEGLALHGLSAVPARSLNAARGGSRRWYSRHGTRCCCSCCPACCCCGWRNARCSCCCSTRRREARGSSLADQRPRVTIQHLIDARIPLRAARARRSLGSTRAAHDLATRRRARAASLRQALPLQTPSATRAAVADRAPPLRAATA
jgi:hypothetical protein